MADAQMSGALAHRSDQDRQPGLSITLEVITGRGMIDLRGETDDAKFMAAAKSALGLALPTTPRTSASKGDVSILWLSVDQWLVTLPRDKLPKTFAALRKKTEGMFALAVDMSDARTVIRVSGDGAREVLMKGTSVDMLAPDIATGTVRRMLFAEIAAACHVISTEPEMLELYVFRSYADYAWEWLLATGRAGAKVRLYGAQMVPGK
jgi:sarcosine oxidase subunit gamma